MELQRSVPCAWCQADVHKNDSSEQKEYYLIAIGTGHDWKDSLNKEQYIGTAFLYGDSLVLHYFIIDAEKHDAWHV